MNLYKTMNDDLKRLHNWFGANKLMLNVTKSNYMIFHSVHTPAPEENKLMVGNEAIKKQTSTKFLGIYLDENLKWTYQINFIGTKLSTGKSLYILRATKNLLPASCRKTLYYTTIYPYLTYGIEMWGTATKELLNKLTKLQNKAIRIVGRAA